MTPSRGQWMLLIASFVVIMLLTMYKDLSLTRDQPNVLFYVFVPPVSMLGSAVIGFGTARLFKLSLGFADMLFITLVTELIGQVFENVSKLVYYLVWQYPGWLYLLCLVPLVFVVPGYLFVRWTKLRWPLALVMALALFLGGLVFGQAFTAVTGITTPGS